MSKIETRISWAKANKIVLAASRRLKAKTSDSLLPAVGQEKKKPTVTLTFWFWKKIRI
jgi:hypothetical protein